MPPPGLADERTTLAWRRTGLALLVNCVLVLARHERSLATPWAVALGTLATVAAALSLLHGARRQRAAPSGPATWPVVTLGVVLTLLTLLTTAALVLRLRWSA